MKKLCPSCGDEFEDSYGHEECEGCREEQVYDDEQD
jgi:predicted amidophosphoribosyltransferase